MGVKAELHTLLERMVLGDRLATINASRQSDVLYSVSHALGALEADREHLASTLYELRLRLALHFAPVNAIAYRRTDTVPRQKLVRQYLESEFGRGGPAVEQLARDVARVLDDWETSRGRVTGHVEALLSAQAGRCAHCGVELRPTPRTVVGQDDYYKPYYESPDELLAPEVDHVEPVGGHGTNRSENLQVLCRLCNLGKGDGLGVDLRNEILFAAATGPQIPRLHRLRMCYTVIDRDRRDYCGVTGKGPQSELTIEKVRADGGYIRSNLRTIVSPVRGAIISVSDEGAGD